MELQGQCHCGEVRYAVDGEPLGHALCHCADCRRHAGAPAVAWAMFRTEAVTTLSGAPKIYKSSEHGRRHFCPECGTGLFYANEAILPGIIDVQSATLDDPDALPLQIQQQTAERIDWMAQAHGLPMYERYRPIGYGARNAPFSGAAYALGDENRREKTCRIQTRSSS